MRPVNKYIQSVIVGILAQKTVIHVAHSQPVTPPMAPERRHTAYVRQNGERKTLTAAQQRQMRRMEERALYAA